MRSEVIEWFLSHNYNCVLLAYLLSKVTTISVLSYAAKFIISLVAAGSIGPFPLLIPQGLTRHISFLYAPSIHTLPLPPLGEKNSLMLFWALPDISDAAKYESNKYSTFRSDKFDVPFIQFILFSQQVYAAKLPSQRYAREIQNLS